MNIPGSWKGVKRPSTTTNRQGVKRRKRNKPSDEVSMDAEVDSKLSMENSSMAHETLYNELRSSVKNCSTFEQNDVLVLDSIISRQPYIKMMQNLFGNYEESCFHQTPSVKIVSKKYEEGFMRECVDKSERPCAMGVSCECMFIDPNNPFIATEFLLPNESSQQEPQMCIICLRKLTQSMFYEIMYRGTQFNGIIQSHGNICDQPGEYHRQAMLVCPPGGPVHCMPIPVVAHQRNRYTVTISMGVKTLRQHRVAYEDFH